MNCLNHSEIESVGKCELCGNPLCEECLIALEDRNYCMKCLSARLEKGKKLPEKAIIQNKSKFWAFVFSVVPGVGYLYLGLMNRGLQTMFLFFGSIFIASFIGFEQLMALVVPVMMFYTIFDTQQLVKNINAGIPVPDESFLDIRKIPFTQSWIGYSLIVIGVLAIFNNVLPSFPYWWQIRKMIPPVLIIGLGIAILYRNTKKEL